MRYNYTGAIGEAVDAIEVKDLKLDEEDEEDEEYDTPGGVHIGIVIGKG